MAFDAHEAEAGAVGAHDAFGDVPPWVAGVWGRRAAPGDPRDAGRFSDGGSFRTARAICHFDVSMILFH